MSCQYTLRYWKNQISYHISIFNEINVLYKEILYLKSLVSYGPCSNTFSHLNFFFPSLIKKPLNQSS